jgi:uncharacterized phage protein (TIGR02220 family)
MFSQFITDSDAFLDLPATTQVLYFHLNMHADDDGFVGNTKSIMRMVGSHDDDLKLLIAKQLVLTFDSGVIVIKDWRLHNSIRKDRYKQTGFKEEFKRLALASNGSYVISAPSKTIETDEKPVVSPPEDDDNQLATNGQPDGNQLATQVRLGKDRLGKDREEHSPAKAEPLNFDKLFEYLNSKSGKHFRNTKTNRDLVKARLAEGFTSDDIKIAIDNVCAGWLGTEMARYIQPSTIFRASKFEGYVNAVPGAPKPQRNYGHAPRVEESPDWLTKQRSGEKVLTIQTTPANADAIAQGLAELKAMREKRKEDSK